MSKLAEVKTPAELHQQEVVTGAELVATLSDYARSGAAISFRTMNEILERNPDIDPTVLASALPSVVSQEVCK